MQQQDDTRIVRRILASSRFFIIAAVLGAFLSSVVLIIAGVMAVVELAWETARHPRSDVAEAKHLSVDFIQLIDVFLLGTVLYIVALGLYELFVDPELPMPGWLRIHDFDELKEKLIGVIIVLLGVTFLGSAVTWTGGSDIFDFGAGIALTIAALTLAMYVTGHRHRQTSDASRHETPYQTAEEREDTPG
jgi:uncharacterized membrane protein YqhA